MNAVVHAEISSKRWKAPAENFLKIHDFMDCSKELIANNLHRIRTHNHFFVKQAMIPIFGHTIHCDNGIKVNLKDCIESDHLLADFGGRMIPSLNDYVDLCSDSPSDKDLIETSLKENEQFFNEYPQIKTLMLEPLFNTGKIKSLLLTFDSWFLNKILPLIFKDIKIEIKDYNIAPKEFFNRCRYASWLDNGRGPEVPPSFVKIEEMRKAKLPKKDKAIFHTIDGSKLRTPVVSDKPITEVNDLSKFPHVYDGSPKEPLVIPNIVIPEARHLEGEYTPFPFQTID